ncbi:MAG: RnfABCDGE type electron transport complex subunit D [Clostridia bacterium]|jgi:electron transport complex protein RnfD|nr:RnfABCDGE type electron transport complex subunit D [Clostridia bacterium]
MKRNHAPFVHIEKTVFSHAAEWLVALTPVLIWSVYMFGARVITLCAVCALVSALLDYPVRRFLLKRSGIAQFDPMTPIYGALTAFMMPVAVPLWIPTVAAVFVVIAKNIRIFRAKRLFNPFVFSASMLHLCFSSQMTAFTRPFAYFNAFSFSIDDKLLESYRVISPLQFMADGSVYEDGVLAQLYGFASGNIGEIAVAAMIISLIWLCVRKEGDWRSTVAFLIPILLLSLALPTDDAESEYYAYSMLLSGGICFLSVFAMNERQTLPITQSGRIIFGAVGGISTFLLHRYVGGFEWGYLVILVLNVLSPFLEMATRPKAIGGKES